MIRTIGFLSGVCLTVTALLLALDSRQSQRPATVPPAGTDATAEELSGVYAAIAEQVDIVPADNALQQTIPPVHESETADSEVQNGVVETSAGVTAAQDAEVSTSAAQADVVPVISADPEPRVADAEPQQGSEQAGLDREHHLHVQAEADEPELPDNGDAGTYLFWSPFRSEWAARGFAGRLTLATQVPVEVISAGPEEYRAAFNYQDETERLARIERIETITGLKLE